MGQGNDVLVIGFLGCIAFIVPAILISVVLILGRKGNLVARLSTGFRHAIDRTTDAVSGFIQRHNGEALQPAVAEVPEEHLALLKRVYALEEEIFTLKSSFQKPSLTSWERMQRGFNFLASYWGFLSFLGSIVLLVYIQLAFGVDYFEGFRDISAEKKLSEFYQKEGDELIKVFEYSAAEAAYQKALETDPHNELASFGLAKSQVFDVEEGQKYLDIQLAERKLDYLLQEFDDDHGLYLLKASIYDLRGDSQEAQAWTDKASKKVRGAIEKRQRIDLRLLSRIDPGLEQARQAELSRLKEDLASCEVMLGYLKQKSDLEASKRHYEEAVRLAPTSVPANNNLGYINILYGDYEIAKRYLNTALYWSPKWMTLVNLGDAALFSNDLQSAEYYYAEALRILEEPDIKPTESFIGGKIIFNYMPLTDGDRDTIQYSTDFVTIESKKSMLYYDLSFVQALNGNYRKANELFNTARKLDSHQIYHPFFAHKLISIKNLVSPDVNAISWIDEHIEALGQTG